MHEPTITIPLSLFKTLDKEAQGLIMGLNIHAATDDDNDEDGPVELSSPMIRHLIQGLKDKSMSVLRGIANSDTNEFELKDLIAAVPGATHKGDLRGAFSAITRRVRATAGDDAYFLWWEDDAIIGHDDEVINQTGWVSEVTHASLKKVLLK